VLTHFALRLGRAYKPHLNEGITRWKLDEGALPEREKWALEPGKRRIKWQMGKGGEVWGPRRSGRRPNGTWRSMLSNERDY